MSLCCFFFNC